jgi:hypothetical protein
MKRYPKFQKYKAGNMIRKRKFTKNRWMPQGQRLVVKFIYLACLMNL